MINIEKYCAWSAKETAKFLIAELHCQLLTVHLIRLRTCKNPTHDTGTAYWHVWWHVCDELVWITSVVKKHDTLACTSTHANKLTNKHWCRRTYTHTGKGAAIRLDICVICPRVTDVFAHTGHVNTYCTTTYSTQVGLLLHDSCIH